MVINVYLHKESSSIPSKSDWEVSMTCWTHIVGMKLSIHHLFDITVHVSGFGGEDFGVLTVEVMLCHCWLFHLSKVDMPVELSQPSLNRWSVCPRRPVHTSRECCTLQQSSVPAHHSQNKGIWTHTGYYRHLTSTGKKSYNRCIRNVVQTNMGICWMNIVLPQAFKCWTFYSTYLLINIQILEKPDIWGKLNDSITQDLHDTHTNIAVTATQWHTLGSTKGSHVKTSHLIIIVQNKLWQQTYYYTFAIAPWCAKTQSWAYKINIVIAYRGCGD